MESNEPMPHPSPEQARASLDDVRRMEADLADRMLTPWWLYPGWGLAEALIVTSLTFPTSLRTPALVVGVAGFGLLISAYKRLTGLGMSSQYFTLARKWSIALMVVILTAFAVMLLVNDEPMVTAATALVVFVATVVLGRRADTEVRHQLRHGARTR